MTITKELTRLANLVCAVLGGDDSVSGEEIEGSLRSLAEKCAGKVLVAATVNELRSGCQAYVDECEIAQVGDGETRADALTDLQALLDGTPEGR